MSDAYAKIWEQALNDVPCAARSNIGFDPVEAFRLAVTGVIQKIADDAHILASMADVGGVETAGSVISYLAANPKKIDLYMQKGISALMEDAPDGPRGFHSQGCLTWHRKGDAKVVTPQDLRISLTVRDLAKPIISSADATRETEIEQAKQIYRDKPKDGDGRMSGSTSYLQRKMQWGYNHAAAIVEELEKRGFLSEPNRNGMRFVTEI